MLPCSADSFLFVLSDASNSQMKLMSAGCHHTLANHSARG